MDCHQRTFQGCSGQTSQLWWPSSAVTVPRRWPVGDTSSRCASGSVEGEVADVEQTCIEYSPYYSSCVTAEATKPGGATVGRRYRSPLREQQTAATRRAVVDAARELFVANGWAATGMREVAAAAGVALETVYSHFSSKRGLLRAVADTAVVGDDASEPLAERAEFLAMGEGRRPARVRAAARLLAAVHARTAAIAKLLRQAAAADQEIAEMLQSTRERQRSDVASALELIVGRAPTSVRARRRLGHRQPRGVPAARRGIGLDDPALRGMGRRNAGAGHSTLLTAGGHVHDDHIRRTRRHHHDAHRPRRAATRPRQGRARRSPGLTAQAGSSGGRSARTSRG